MTYKYQLIFLGQQSQIRDEISTLLNERLKQLNLPEDYITILDSSSIDCYKGNMPTFAIYIGGQKHCQKDKDIVTNLLKDGVMILPIYFESFGEEIPEFLSNQNGKQYCESENDCIVNIILEAFELLRSSRKIFISYRRLESRSVAIQLYEALEEKNFDVFLDTHSIRPGEAFQDELWHRMTDCDVIVLLNTKGFLDSHWCKDEFAEAATKQIGIVQLVWPDHKVDKIANSSHISLPIQLSESDFENQSFGIKDQSRLTTSAVDQVAVSVESIRARNLAARQDNLITEFLNFAKKYDRDIHLQPEKFLTEELSDKNVIIYIPAIGIPQSTTYQSAEIKKTLQEYENASIRIIYDDLRIRDKWLKHLDWLNENLKTDIKTLKKKDFDLWLQQK